MPFIVDMTNLSSCSFLYSFNSRSWTKIIRSLSIHGRGLVAATVFFKTTVVDCSFYFTFFKTTVVGCSFYSTLCKNTVVDCSFYSTLCKNTVVDCSFCFTLCKTTVVGRLPPIISRKYHLRITPDGYKGNTFFLHSAKKIKKQEWKMKGRGELKIKS